jgi:hypothetical protein
MLDLNISQPYRPLQAVMEIALLVIVVVSLAYQSRKDVMFTHSEYQKCRIMHSDTTVRKGLTNVVVSLSLTVQRARLLQTKLVEPQLKECEFLCN